MGLRRGVGVTGRGEGQGGVRVQVGVPCTARASAEAARSAVVRRRSVRPPHASSHLVWYRVGVQRRLVVDEESSHRGVRAACPRQPESVVPSTHPGHACRARA